MGHGNTSILPREAAAAFIRGQKFGRGSVTVTEWEGDAKGWQMILHGSVIATRHASVTKPNLRVSLAGYNTVLTRRYLTGVVENGVGTDRGVTYIGTIKLDGNKVGRDGRGSADYDWHSVEMRKDVPFGY